MQFSAQYKISMQLYKMIKKNSSALYKSASRPQFLYKARFLIILYNCIEFLYFLGKLYVTSQQIYMTLDLHWEEKIVNLHTF